MIVAGEGEILPQHLPPALRGASGAPAPAGEEQDVIRVPVGSTVEEAEKMLILRTLAHAGNKQNRTATVLGISLKTLHNKIKAYTGADGVG